MTVLIKDLHRNLLRKNLDPNLSNESQKRAKKEERKA